MSLTSPSTIVISDAAQLERLTEIREKLVASPATESTLSDCKDFLIALLAELENKADGDETQPISGTVAVNNFPANQPVSVTNFPATQPVSGNVGFVSVNRSTAFISATGTGTIAAGAQSVAIANIGNAIGTVKQTNLPAGASISWGANANDRLDSIDYDATGTTFLITTVT